MEWLSDLVQLQSHEVAQQLAATEFPQLLLQTMQKYEMNSLLHTKVLNVFSEAIKTEDESLIDAVMVLLSI